MAVTVAVTVAVAAPRNFLDDLSGGQHQTRSATTASPEHCGRRWASVCGCSCCCSYSCRCSCTCCTSLSLTSLASAPPLPRRGCGRHRTQRCPFPFKKKLLANYFQLHFPLTACQRLLSRPILARFRLPLSSRPRSRLPRPNGVRFRFFFFFLHFARGRLGLVGDVGRGRGDHPRDQHPPLRSCQVCGYARARAQALLQRSVAMTVSV